METVSAIDQRAQKKAGERDDENTNIAACSHLPNSAKDRSGDQTRRCFVFGEYRHRVEVGILRGPSPASQSQILTLERALIPKMQLNHRHDPQAVGEKCAPLLFQTEPSLHFTKDRVFGLLFQEFST